MGHLVRLMTMKLDGQQKLYTYIELHVQSISFWDHALASSLPNPLRSLKYWARDQMKNQDCLSEHVQIYPLFRFYKRQTKVQKKIEQCSTIRSKTARQKVHKG
jgi:hypothetical protein